MRSVRTALLFVVASVALVTHAGCTDGTDAGASVAAPGVLADGDADVPSPTLASSSGAEQCGDDVDDDGNGSADDGCACVSDRPCTPPGAGACTSGVQRCVVSGEFRRYDLCRATPGPCDDAAAPDAAPEASIDATPDTDVDATAVADAAVDAGPLRSTVSALALAVSASGRVIATDGHVVRCLDANLLPEGAPITVPSGAWRPSVVRARVSEHAAYFVRGGTPPQRTMEIVLFDASCAISASISIRAATGEVDEWLDGAMDDDGNLYVLYQDSATRTLRSYAPDGSIRFEATEPRGTTTDMGQHLAIRASTGEGVVGRIRLRPRTRTPRPSTRAEVRCAPARRRPACVSRPPRSTARAPRTSSTTSSA